MKRWVKAALAVLALGAGAAGWSLSRTTAIPARFVVDAAFHAEVALVPSGDPGPRTLAAVALVKAGRADRVLISGAGYGGDSSAVLGAYAVEQGLSQDKLQLETRATSTWENMAFSAPLLRAQSAKRVVVVTSAHHARRAALAAERALPGVEVRVLGVEEEAPPSVLIPEWLKTARYAWKGWVPWSGLWE